MKELDKLDTFEEHLVGYISNYIVDVTEAERKSMLKLLRFSPFNKGEFIFKQGEVPKKVCFLIKGAVRFYYVTEEGKDHTTNFGFENEPVLPYGSFVEQVPSGIAITALEPAELVWASSQDFNLFMEEHPRFQIGIAKLLGEYLFKGSEQLSLLRISSSRERYEKLCELQPEIISRFPLTHIASYLDMALETLSRIRAGKL